MLEHVLAVTAAKMKSSDKMNQLVVQTGNAHLLACFLPQLANVRIHFLLSFGNDFVNAGGMDAAVLDQFFQRESGRFPANFVESGDHDHAGSIVNDHVDTGGFFKGTNVAAFTSDDAAFHVVIGNIDRGDGHL